MPIVQYIYSACVKLLKIFLLFLTLGIGSSVLLRIFHENMTEVLECGEEMTISLSDPNFVNDKIIASSDNEDERYSSRWPRWRPTSKAMLKECEQSILSYAKTPYEGFYVNVGPVVGQRDSKIWTVAFNKESKNTPLILIHGMGAGLAMWILNFDEFAKTRPVYAIDILGFGRSSRPNFSTDAEITESELVSSIEIWRKVMNLDKIILLGHSFGGYLVTAYSLKHPERVSHLILADPWGFKDKPEDLTSIRRIPSYIRVLIKLFEPLNPLWALRAAGPMGPGLIQRMRSDLMKKYIDLLGDDAHLISMYLYHSNAQYPAGEAAFHAMMSTFGWAKNPMHYRIADLSSNVPLTLLYGGHSWVDHYPADKIKEKRSGSKLAAYVIDGAGHHIYADGKKQFNQLVLYTCALVDAENLVR